MNGRTMLLLSLMAVCAATAALHHPAAAQQVCGFCSDAVTPDGWTHQFSGGGAWMACANGDCHYEPYEGKCLDIHIACGVAAAKALGGVLAAAGQHDVHKLGRVLGSFPRFVRLQPAVSALEVLNCDGTVAARVPLTAEAAARLAVVNPPPMVALTRMR